MESSSLTRKSGENRSVRAAGFWIALVAVALLVALLLNSEFFNDLVEEATHWAKGVINEYPVAGAVVFFILSAASAMLAFASSVILVPPATEVWGKPATFLLLWGGWMAGAIAAYGIGRLARPLVVRMGYKHKLEEYERLVSKRMKFWAVLLFCIALQSEIPGYLLGGMRYSLLKFIAAIGIAEAIYAVAVIAAGESILNGEPVLLLTTVTVLVVVAVGAGLLFRKFRKRKS